MRCDTTGLPASSSWNRMKAQNQRYRPFGYFSSGIKKEYSKKSQVCDTLASLRATVCGANR
ncbi:MAG: hypothetical protein PHQ39_03265 [Methanothrix soehngenii]|nr:hypothetical protein [Methanothrix soehngenii]